MLFYGFEKTGAFIDGQSVYFAQKSLGFEVDFRKLLEYLRSEAWLVRAFYYAVAPEEGEHIATKPLIDWLDYNGYTVRVRYRKAIADTAGRKRSHHASLIDLVVEAMRFARHVDHIVIFSAEADLVRLVNALTDDGKRVTIIGPIETANSAGVADDLRRSASQFIDLKQLIPAIGRSQRSVNEPILATQPV